MRPASFTQLRGRAQQGLITPFYLYRQAQAGTCIRDLARACGVKPIQIRQAIAEYRDEMAWQKQVTAQQLAERREMRHKAKTWAKDEKIRQKVAAKAKAKQEECARNALIIQMSQSGMKYADIGARFGLTYERVRQIVRRGNGGQKQ